MYFYLFLYPICNNVLLLNLRIEFNVILPPGLLLKMSLQVRSVAGPVMQGYVSLVEVDMLELSESWCWDFTYQHGTGPQDGEGIRPESDTGNGREVIN